MLNNRITELIQKLPNSDMADRKSIREEILSLAKQLRSPESLTPFLDNDSYLVREIVAFALGVINHESCVQHLTDLLNTEQNRQVQMAAVYSLRDIASFLSLEALLNIASSDQYSELVRSLAVQSVALSILNTLIDPLFEVLKKATSTRDTKLVESVFDGFKTLDDDKHSVPNRLHELLHLKDTPDYLLLYIIDYLGERRFVQAFDDILAFLDSDDTDLQRAAAKALGNLGIKEAIVKLQDKLDHEDELVRYNVEQALHLLRSK